MLIASDQPRPHPAHLDAARKRRQVRAGPGSRRHAARGRLRARSFAGRGANDVGGDRRRAHPPDARRRAELDRRDARRAATVGESVDPRGEPLGRAHRLRGHQHAAPRRLESAYLADARPGQDLEGDRPRHRSRAG